MRIFPAIRIEGGLFSPDLLDKLLSGDLPGQKPKDFWIEGRRPLNDEIAGAFADARALWGVFKHRLERLSPSELATSETREYWVIPFLRLLDYELQYNPRAYEVDGHSFAISHRAGQTEDSPPVHIVGARQELGRLAPSGRPRLAPHSLLQEYLNRSDRLWGVVTNGFILRLLRQSTYVRKQAYVEFDLASIMEEQHFQDFSILYRLIHRSRLPRVEEEASHCLLEQYYKYSVEQGGRVRDKLRDGVEECLKRLANGFLQHPHNQKLRERVVKGQGQVDSIKPKSSNSEEQGAGNDQKYDEYRLPLSPEELYRQLLRLVYRMLFMLVSEERGLISPDPIFQEHYGISRLRRLIDQRGAYTEYDDLWHSLRVTWRILSNEKFSHFFKTAPLNGELFAPIELDSFTITNKDLLESFKYLAYYQESPSQPPRRVNYAALDVEELGSVYESLLEYKYHIDTSGPIPHFDLIYGSERKSTGSYYTPPELVAELIRSALDPVIQDRLEEVKRIASSDWLMVKDPYRKEFIHYASQRLQRTGSVATGAGNRKGGISSDQGIPQGGSLRDDFTDPKGSDFNSSKCGGRMGTTLFGGVHSISADGQRQPDGIGNTSDRERGRWPLHGEGDPATASGDRNSGQTTPLSGAQPPTEKEVEGLWKKTPFVIRHSLLASSAILNLKICDPASGSGHFLLAAARRLGKELARIRTGEDEPAPERQREAIRDVVSHYIYGVDKNPLAVELCRVALWIESHAEGKPLTFLDHRIRCGDSLVGVMDLEVLKEGIPDEAFTPISDDDRDLAKSLKRQNRDERWGQLTFFSTFNAAKEIENLSGISRELDEIPDVSPEAIREKSRRFIDLQRQSEVKRIACNLWTGAFFQPRNSETQKTALITTDTLFSYLESNKTNQQSIAHAQTLASKYRFFHWPLEFPDVFVSPAPSPSMKEGRGEGVGGFDVILCNPPWERIKLQEQEFFAALQQSCE